MKSDIFDVAPALVTRNFGGNSWNDVAVPPSRAKCNILATQLSAYQGGAFQGFFDMSAVGCRTRNAVFGRRNFGSMSSYFYVDPSSPLAELFFSISLRI